jgi:S1-C subfamily serine protease
VKEFSISRTTGSIPVSILEIDVPASSWPRGFEAAGDHFAVQIHANKKSWTILLYKDTGEMPLMDPDPAEIHKQQLLETALQLAITARGIIRQSEDPTVSPPTILHDDLESLITDATVRIKVADRFCGSGVITEIRGKKYVVTANHCIPITEPGAIIITTHQYDCWGEVNYSVGLNDGFDVAAFRLPEPLEHLPAVPLLEGQVPVGQPVHLSGFPLGHYRITTGEIREYRREGTELIHSAPSERGSSGGMLITDQGYLCGIHSEKSSSAAPWCFSESPHYPKQYAIPSSLIMRLVERYDW